MEQTGIQEISDFDYLKCPKEGYLYFPKGDELQSGKEKKILRWYFDGDSEYTEFEDMRYKKLTDYLEEKKKEEVIKGWSKQEIMRELQGCQFDCKKTTKSMADRNDWLEVSKYDIDDQVKKILASGFLKILGRDHRYRPILLMNFYLLDMKENSKESILKTIDYVSTMVIDKMMIPGQIENWVTIMDLNQASLGSIPVSTIKTIVGYLSNHYKSRLFRLYMINTTSSVTTIWKTIKFFLDEITVKKINILKEGTPEKLYLHCNKSQIPIKFGGSQPDEEVSWPPKLNDKGPFLAEGEEKCENILTIEQYKEHSKSIKEGVVCKELLE